MTGGGYITNHIKEVLPLGRNMWQVHVDIIIVNNGHDKQTMIS